MYYEQKISLDGYEKVEEELVGFENGSYTGEVVTGENVTISPKEKNGFNINSDLTELTGNVEA
ncbi:hypothetical protein IKJ53_05400, partial [bacterium]|nr:hypothetical protein [bacterium]